MALAENVKIDRSRQVLFKDDYSLDLSHSSGQRIECHVEVIIRDKPSDKTDLGDILIVASNADGVKKWLLFPPIEKQYMSARIGKTDDEVVVMIRNNVKDWNEIFLLKTEEPDAAADLIDIVGSSPMPPTFIHDDISVVSKLTESHIGGFKKGGLDLKDNLEVPIGERSRKVTDQEHARRQAEEAAAVKDRRATPTSGKSPTVLSDNSVSTVEPKDLNQAMKKAGKPAFTATMHARARYHSRESSQSSLPPSPTSLAKHYPERPWKMGDYDCVTEDHRKEPLPEHEYYMSGGMGEVEATTPRRHSPSPKPVTPKQSTPLKESMKPETNTFEKPQQSPVEEAKDDTPPPPPVHRTPTLNKMKKIPVIDTPTSQAKNRRTSSPLKHEYQPSIASETSSSSEDSDSDASSYTESSDEDELEAAELLPPPPSQHPKRSSPPVSLYNLPNGSVAPSNSASQAPYRGVPTKPIGVKKLVAFISAWDDKHGRYIDLHTEPCSIMVSPGKIEAFEMSAAHSSPRRDPSGMSEAEQYAADDARPLIEQGLTPHVTLRRGTAVDLNVASRPTSNSLLKVNGTQIRYRTNTVPDNIQLYSLVHTARMQNPVFLKLEQDRILNSYGTNVYDAAVGNNRRRSIFGRKNSYRASTRAPSATPSDEQSTRSLSSSTVSRLRRMSGSMFNIGKSTIGHIPFPASQYGSSSTSTATTPPRSPSLAGTTTSAFARIGNENLKIRLYYCVSLSTWDDRGAARITITAPPPGMRPRTTINQGITRRVVVTQEVKDKENGTKIVTVLDDVLGADCFSKMGTTGVVCQVWDEVRGDNGEVGTVGKNGGVSGRMRKWCFQTGRAGDADWILSLCSIRG